MNLKTAKSVLMILGVLLAASLLGGILTKKELFYWLDALIALCTIVFHVRFWRCPKCRKRHRDSRIDQFSSIQSSPPGLGRELPDFLLRVKPENYLAFSSGLSPRIFRAFSTAVCIAASRDSPRSTRVASSALASSASAGSA